MLLGKHHSRQWECLRSGKDVPANRELERDQRLGVVFRFPERKFAHDRMKLFRFLFAYTRVMSRYTKATHTVYLHFMNNHLGWHCQFLEADLKTSLPRTFTFASAEKIRELARRGEAWGNLESKQALEHGIEMGRGGVYLKLTPEQYARLTRK